MRLKIIDLESRILENKCYLFKNFPNTEAILSQITMILDFGLSNDKIEEWLRLNKISINLIDEFLDDKYKDISLKNSIIKNLDLSNEILQRKRD